MQFSSQAKPPVGILLDCDLGNRIDDVLALALLYGFDGKNEARATAVSISKSNLKAAELCEIVGRFYGVSYARALPIGLSTAGRMPEDTSLLTGTLAKKTAAGEPLYPHDIRKLRDTADPMTLLRNALTAQYDQNAIMVLTGPATNLANLLDMPGVKNLITTKVRFLSMMGGSYPQGQPEFNIKTDVAAAKKVFAEWPTPIVASGYEVGEKLLFPGASIEKDFAWSQAHPVVDAYRASQVMPYDTPTWDMTAVLYAVRPKEGYFQLSDPGTITVLDDGRTRFTAAAQGKHRYLIADPAQQERILKTLTEVASAKPVPRIPRFLQQQQVAPPKPDEAKPDAAKPSEPKPPGA